MVAFVLELGPNLADVLKTVAIVAGAAITFWAFFRAVS
jgi:hypothetical protein